MRKLNPRQATKRGRPPEHQPEEYGAVAIYRKHFFMVLRSTEGDIPLVLGKRMDHSTIWWGFQRMPVEYVNSAIELLFELIIELLPPDFFIPDANGVQTDQYRKRKRPRLRPEDKPPPNRLKGREKSHSEEREHITLKLHLLVGCCREPGILPVLRARITRGYVHDSPQLKHLIGKFKGEGKPFPLTQVMIQPTTTFS